MVTLNEWFEKKEYATGLALLAKHSKNRYMLQNLSRKHHPEKLEHELKKYVTTRDPDPAVYIEPIKPAAIETEVKVRIVAGNKRVEYEKLPPELRKLWDFNRDAYKEIRALHEKLKLMEKGTDADRAPLVERACILDEKLRENWDQIDAWQVEAVAGEPKKIDHKRINSNRKYISINLKVINGLKDEKADELRKKLQERVDELKEAGEKLNIETKALLKANGVVC